MKIHRWGFDNNDLSSIQKNKGNIQEVVAAILDYLETWENCSIIGRWCDQLLVFSSLVEKPPTLSDTTTSSLTAGESLLQKCKHGGISGSYQCVQQINKKKTDRKTNALERVVKKMGEESFNALKETWNAMKTRYDEAEWEQGEGVILGLMAQGYSNREIKALLGVGGSHVSRLRKIYKDRTWDGSHTRRPMKVPHHVLSSDDLTAFIEDCKTWELEDGFPCSHGRPRQYFVEAKLTWTELWKRYEKKMVSLERQVMSFS
jgi:transposase